MTLTAQAPQSKELRSRLHPVIVNWLDNHVVRDRNPKTGKFTYVARWYEGSGDKMSTLYGARDIGAHLFRTFTHVLDPRDTIKNLSIRISIFFVHDRGWAPLLTPPKRRHDARHGGGARRGANVRVRKLLEKWCPGVSRRVINERVEQIVGAIATKTMTVQVIE